MVFIFFGPPGSGKGTQASELERKYKTFVHVSTGDLLRSEMALGTDLGKLIQDKVNSGYLVPDDMIIKLVSDIVDKYRDKHIVLDGFPRTLVQAIELDRILELKDLKISLVFNFDINMKDLTDRIQGRYTCAECGAVYNKINKNPKVEGICDICSGTKFIVRQDDDLDVFQKRVSVYNDETLPVKKYYDEKGILKRVDAANSTEVVCYSIVESLRETGIIN